MLDQIKGLKYPIYLFSVERAEIKKLAVQIANYLHM